MHPLVSVIVPVYNTSKYLRQCLDSIQAQTLKEIEIICVDDGSTDDSMEILLEKDLQDPRIHILQQKNKGGGAARNLGMSVATGDYLLFLDSDDFFEATFIEKMYNTAVETSADMVICQHKSYDTRTGEFSGTSGINPQFVSKKRTRIYNGIPVQDISCLNLFPWNKLCSHEFIKENNIYFQETYHHNDNYFSITTSLSAKKIAVIPDVLIYYRVGMNTNTQSTLYRHPQDLFSVISLVHQYLVRTNQLQKYEISYYEYIINSYDGQLHKLRNSECCLDNYKVALQIIKGYDMSNFSLKSCHNKLSYIRYLKLIEYPYSKYLNENKTDSLFFLLRHPLVLVGLSIYLLKNAWWYLKAYGIRDVFYQAARVTRMMKLK